MTDPSPPSGHHLVFDRYGKAEVRLVHVDRSAPQHELRDLTVSTALRGDFDAAYTAGDNAAVLPTDSQKNAVYGLAREHGVGEPEDFAAALARHLLDACAAAAAAEVDVLEHGWSRIGEGGGRAADHAFARAGAEVRTARLVLERGGTAVLHAGLRDLVVLKTTGSEFAGFPRDRFTTLAETHERILATSVTATWRYRDGVLGEGLDLGALWTQVRAVLVAAFAGHHSRALQETLHAMAAAVLDAHPEVEEVALVMPNKHHFLVDLAPFGLDNPHAVYVAADRPYGLIEGTLRRAGKAPDAG